MLSKLSQVFHRLCATRVDFSFCSVFFWQVNGQNVVKVGHRQVVNMIRQGGNSLMVKVVMVARNPELEDTARKRGTSQIFVLHHLNSVFIM